MGLPYFLDWISENFYGARESRWSLRLACRDERETEEFVTGGQRIAQPLWIRTASLDGFLNELQRSSGPGIRRKAEDPRNVGGGECFVVAQGEHWDKCLQSKLLRQVRSIAIQRDDCESVCFP
jgi:hypothetical protein